MQINNLAKYKDFLENGTYDGADWSSFDIKPKSRYTTFKYAFEHFKNNNTNKTIVELGTSRSFVHGGLPGCNENDPVYWTPTEPKNWDWGAGLFIKMASESLYDLEPILNTVDISSAHIERSKIINAAHSDIINFHVMSSVDFLQLQTPKSIDLLYLDTGDMTPIEPTAQLQLAEAKKIVELDLLTDNGLILIDDVKNQTPAKFGETSKLGKSKYAIPYLLENNYEIVMDEYQVCMQKKKSV
jgi:hypothetical protein